jgi:hypothetical protein
MAYSADEEHGPIEVGIAWAVVDNKEFIFPMTRELVGQCDGLGNLDEA